MDYDVNFELSPDVLAMFEKIYFTMTPLDMYLFQDTTIPVEWGLLCKSFPNNKVKSKNKLDNMVSKGRAIFKDIYEAWITAIQNNDEMGQKENEDFGIFQEIGMNLLNKMRTAHGE